MNLDMDLSCLLWDIIMKGIWVKMTSNILFFVFTFYFTKSKCNFLLRFPFCYDNGYYLEEKFSSQYQCTLGCIMQEGDRLLFFRLFSQPQNLIKTPKFINSSQSCQKSYFTSKHKEHKTVFISCFTFRQLFEKILLYCIHVLRRWFERHHCIAVVFWT